MVVFGHRESEYLAIQVFGRMHEASDYDDGNWVDAEISMSARGLGGSYWAGLRAEEFERLRDDLVPMYESLRGSASLDSLEGWLKIEIDGDGMGHFDVRYLAVSRHSPRTALESSLRFDQTELPGVIDQLGSIITAFPVVGERPS